jgi:hypothetical protein
MAWGRADTQGAYLETVSLTFPDNAPSHWSTDQGDDDAMTMGMGVVSLLFIMLH